MHPKIIRLFRVLLFGIILGFVVLGCLPVIFQNKMIYFPQRYERSFRPGGPGLEKFQSYTTADGREQWGYLIEPAPAEPGPPAHPRGDEIPESNPANNAPAPRPRFYLVFNGNASTAMGLADFYERLAQETGCGFFIPDYRGYGFNDGRPTESNLVADVLGAYDSMEKAGRFSGGVGVIGQSLGGAAAFAVAEQRRVDRIITLSTFTSIDAMARETVFWPIYHFCFNHWPNDQRLEEILSRPEGERPRDIILFHGRRDEIIPFKMGERLAAIGGEQVTFIPLDGAHPPGRRDA